MSETPPQSEIVLYQTEDGRTRVQCRFENETIWLTQKLMSDLFQKDVRTISEHIGTILAEGELTADSVIRKFRITAADGKLYETQHYGLQMILAVGYRVRSQRGTQFRQWATAVKNKVHQTKAYFHVFSPTGMHLEAQGRREAAHPGTDSNRVLGFPSPKEIHQKRSARSNGAVQ